MKELLGKLNNNLEDFLSELHEINRPRVFFDIRPDKNKSNFLVIVLRNVGRTPAYNVNCSFEPDIPYYEKTNLSDLSIFRSLPFLEPGDEIEFFFNSFDSYLAEPKNPKIIKTTLTYKDSKGTSYNEHYMVDVERYKGLLSVEERSIKDIVNELSNIKRELRSIKHGVSTMNPSSKREDTD